VSNVRSQCLTAENSRGKKDYSCDIWGSYGVMTLFRLVYSFRVSCCHHLQGSPKRHLRPEVSEAVQFCRGYAGVYGTCLYLILCCRVIQLNMQRLFRTWNPINNARSLDFNPIKRHIIQENRPDVCEMFVSHCV
jgi:hypothetical protein